MMRPSSDPARDVADTSDDADDADGMESYVGDNEEEEEERNDDFTTSTDAGVDGVGNRGDDVACAMGSAGSIGTSIDADDVDRKEAGTDCIPRTGEAFMLKESNDIRPMIHALLNRLRA